MVYSLFDYKTEKGKENDFFWYGNFIFNELKCADMTPNVCFANDKLLATH